MTKIALMGAGGKMGVRLATNLNNAKLDVDYVEISAEGRRRLSEIVGIEAVDQVKALTNADVVILAVPDRLIGKIATAIESGLKPGTALIVLDAAAPWAGEMPNRPDLTYFCTHPCHPALFDFTPDVAAQKDFFGGIAGPQGIVCALIQGPEEHYEMCEKIARAFYAPVARSHRCTLEHIALLEPALSETVGATLCLALREATDRAISMGVPKDAAIDFMLGHLKIELGIAFQVFPGVFSDGALHAINASRPLIFKEDWLGRVFAREAISQSVKDICNPPPK